MTVFDSTPASRGKPRQAGSPSFAWERRHRTIFYMIGSLDIGGAERQLALISPRLMQRGWHPVSYCISERGKLAGEVEKSGVELIGPPLNSITGRSRTFKAVAFILSCLKLFGLLLRRRPRIIHFFLPMAYLVGAPLALVARIPTRIMSRRSLNLYQDNHPVLRKLELRLHRHMSTLLGNSKAVVSELIAEGSAPRRTMLIYNGIEIADVDQDAARGNSSSDAKPRVLIIVANLIPYKAHTDLFHGLATIAARLPPSWKLLCVDRDDSYGEVLENLARDLKLSHHIEFLGERRDVGSLLHSADIGILCSHQEGFSNAILEGMAAGLAMVVTDVGGNAEAVVGGETGLVVPPKDSIALGGPILQLASDPALRRRMGSAARLRVQALFSLDRGVESHDSLYRALNTSA